MIFKRSVAAGGLLCLLVPCALVGAPPVAADDGDPAEPPKVELVLDVSGSMRARDIDGLSRMAVAQHSFGAVVDSLPAGTQLGIRVLGARYRFPGSPKAALGAAGRAWWRNAHWSLMFTSRPAWFKRPCPDAVPVIWVLVALSPVDTMPSLVALPPMSTDRWPGIASGRSWGARRARIIPYTANTSPAIPTTAPITPTTSTQWNPRTAKYTISPIADAAAISPPVQVSMRPVMADIIDPPPRPQQVIRHIRRNRTPP
ncbi:hypothetical protein [Actinomadura sp.]|uniref:hypothetical protein n=1 Tax=Actinomadura sp. TaxID=1989 RepID=UPI0037C5F7BC